MSRDKLLPGLFSRVYPRFRTPHIATMVTGVVLAITFFGLAVLALSVRSARGIGGGTRSPFSPSRSSIGPSTPIRSIHAPCPACSQ